MPTTTVAAGVNSGSAGATKTMLQIATSATRELEVISWGFSLNGTNPGGVIDLCQANVGATVTAHVAAGVQPLDAGSNFPASLVTLGTTATGYTATAEGAVTQTRVFDAILDVAQTPSMYEYQFMPDERPRVAPSSFLRIRTGFNTATGVLCWVVWDE